MCGRGPDWPVSTRVFSPPMWWPLSGPGQQSLDWTRPGALSALSSPATSQHTHHHTPKDTRKNSKICYPWKVGGKKSVQSIRGSWGMTLGRVWLRLTPVTPLSDVQSQARAQCPDPLMGQSPPESPVLGTGSPRPMSRMSQGQGSSQMSHLSQLPRYTPECQQIAHYPVCDPGGWPGPDTRQTDQSPRGDDDWDQDSGVSPLNTDLCRVLRTLAVSSAVTGPSWIALNDSFSWLKCTMHALTFKTKYIFMEQCAAPLPQNGCK